MTHNVLRTNLFQICNITNKEFMLSFKQRWMLLTFIDLLYGTKCLLNRGVVVWGVEVEQIHTVGL